MPDGPGRYNDECTAARESANAQACILIVLGGNRGNGFEVQHTHPDFVKDIPKLLREAAYEIERTVNETPDQDHGRR